MALFQALHDEGGDALRHGIAPLFNWQELEQWLRPLRDLRADQLLRRPRRHEAQDEPSVP